MVRRQIHVLCAPVLCALCLGALLWLPAVASANAFSVVSAALGNSSTGTIPLCQFSNAELQAALREEPAYTVEYNDNVTIAIQTAISAQAAKGDCHTHAATSGGPQQTLAGATGSGLPASVTSHTASGIPLLVAVILTLAALAILGLGAGVLLGFLGWDARAGRAAGHSLREAEYRISAHWQDLADRLRGD